MNQFFSTLIKLIVTTQLINNITSSSTNTSCLNECSSALYETDWTGERLQLKLAATLNDANPKSWIAIRESAKVTVVEFSCSRRLKEETNGQLTKRYYPNDKVTFNGTAIFLNDDVESWCNWEVIREDNSIFPLELIEPAEFNITDSYYKAVIHLNETLPISPANFSNLPEDLAVNFGGYNVIGNSRYLLFTKVDEAIHFALAVQYEEEMAKVFPKMVTINFASSPYGLSIDCNFDWSNVTGSLYFAGKPFYDDVTHSYSYRLTDNQIVNGTICQWTLPTKIEYGSKNGYLQLKKTPLEATIIGDKRFEFFSDPNFRLSTSSATGLISILSKSLIAFMVLVINKLLI